MTVAFQRMFGILERWNNNQVTPSLSKPHELSNRSNIKNYTYETVTRKKMCSCLKDFLGYNSHIYAWDS